MATQAMSSFAQAGSSAINKSRQRDGLLAKATPDLVVGEAELLEDEQNAEEAVAEIMQTVRVIGGGMIGLAVLVVVLTEVFQLEVIANASGPFSGVIDSLTSTGGAALGLIVIGFLVLAANQVMGFFGGGGF